MKVVGSKPLKTQLHLAMKVVDGTFHLLCPKVDVQGSASSNVVVISLNQAANIVEKKIPEMEEYENTNECIIKTLNSVCFGPCGIWSFNSPINLPLFPFPILPRSLGRALGWTVRVIRVSSSNGGEAESRTFRNDVKTFVLHNCHRCRQSHPC